MSTSDPQLSKKFLDLAAAAERKNSFTFTGFLGLSEKAVLLETLDHELKSGVKIYYELDGGHENAERVICRFGDPEELGYTEVFPIACIKIEPLNAKFSDKLTHRDYLGALMNLGITRATIGDIICTDKAAWIFCSDKMAEMIEKELVRIKHTTVVAKRTEEIPQAENSDGTEMVFTVSSVRADALIAAVYKKSRSQSFELFRAGLVYIDGRLCENPSHILKEGQSVNVRGFGKFIYENTQGESKKGKFIIKIKKFG